MQMQDLGKDQPFFFSCGPEIECFTKCCQKLKLVLTPCDVIKAKNFLKLSSSDFLDEYCDLRYEEGVFPLYYLRMNEDGRCPFVSTKGCTIYPARPAACRLYPVARGSTFINEEKDVYFLLKEDHCLGHGKGRSWTISEWLSHEGLAEYDQVNRQWVQIVTSGGDLLKTRVEERIKMFLMVSYNVNKFREFVFGSSFLKKFNLPSQKIQQIKEDDLELLQLGLRWLNVVLYGRQVQGFRDLRA